MTKATREDLRGVLEQYPSLTDSGMTYACGLGRGTAEYAASFERARDTILHRDEVFARLCDWLRPMKRTKHVNRKRNSYGIKQLSRGDLGEYVSNGLLIAAAAHLGFDIKCYPGEASVHINISERALNNTQLGKQRAAARSRWAMFPD